MKVIRIIKLKALLITLELTLEKEKSNCFLELQFYGNKLFFLSKLDERFLKKAFDIRAFLTLKVEWEYVKNAKIIRYLENEAGLAVLI